jgi:hypothetical protein
LDSNPEVEAIPRIAQHDDEEKQERDKQTVEAATTFLDDLVVYLELHPETPD